MTLLLLLAVGVFVVSFVAVAWAARRAPYGEEIPGRGFVEDETQARRDLELERRGFPLKTKTR